MAKKSSVVGYVVATSAGAIIATLAIRAFDKHILKKGEPEQDAFPVASPQQNPMHQMMAAPVMPVFLPSAPYMAPMAPPTLTPPTLGAPSGPVPQEEIDVVSEIEEEWDA